MIAEVLVATVSQKCHPTDGDAKLWEERLHYLFDYAKLFDDANEWFDDSETDAIVKTISELKILDPAVGSGAFPMGILHKLTLALRRLDPDNTRWEKLQKERALHRAEAAFDTKDDRTRREELLEIDETFKRYRDSDFGRKLYLIQNSVFGVDIQPMACQIAKLRFFISLTIEQEPDSAADNFGIKPLPNLETRFITAHTLIGFQEQRTLTSNKARDLEQELRDNRERHFHATTRQRKRVCKQKDEELRSELAIELKSFGIPADDAEKIAQWDPYDQNATADWFDPKLMFGITEGFDVVIGNPPYVQLQKDNGRLGNLYQDMDFEVFARTGDIYCLFYERGIRLLMQKGYLCYITSNKWMRAGYGKNLRQFFAENINLKKLLDLGPDIFDATVDTNILLCTKKSEDEAISIACTVKDKRKQNATTLFTYAQENSVDFSLPPSGDPWVILSTVDYRIKSKIEKVGTLLKNWDISIYRGIITGYNTAFLIDNQTKETLIKTDPKSAEIIKPVLRGRDIKRYQSNWTRLWLISTHNGYGDLPAIDVNNYPIVKKYLGQFYTHLKKRHDKGNTPYNLRNCAYHAEFEKAKIVYPETTQAANFFYDDGQYFLEKTCFMITGNSLKILIGLLSSTLMTFAYKHYYSGTILGKKGYQYNKHALEKLPVVKIPTSQQSSFITLVDQILAAKAANSEANTTDLEKEIDKLVYALYDLTSEEIAVVEATEG